MNCNTTLIQQAIVVLKLVLALVLKNHHDNNSHYLQQQRLHHHLQKDGRRHEVEYSHVWLRDHCPCPICIHTDHRQKMHSSGNIPADIRPKRISLTAEDTLQVVWSHDLINRSGDHVSHYSLSALMTAMSYPNTVTNLLEKPVFWRSNNIDFTQLWVNYSDLINNTAAGLRRCLHLLARYGLCFIDDVPNDWDVRSVPQATNIAYTDVDLDLHMDLLYFESPPGLQLLHCLANSVNGGSSVFADAYRAAYELRARSPTDFDILRSVPVTFHYQNDGHHLQFRRPTIIATDEPTSASSSSLSNSARTLGFMAQNSPLMVNYAPPFQGMLEIADKHIQKDFYRAFNHFESILQEDGMKIEYTLQKGQCAIFANRRVLHGRRAFDANSGHRHLRGTYVDLDAFQDRYRVTCGAHQLQAP
ncbi:hypothetical protein BDF19DRAFT_471329 [Syncephalis fuscata]|nr:hypothetical protein BDF19DRAFT_471329 [Syncephalis fuscata]